ncbi:MAG: bifunctional adenosylcobinamide kinase/adenosylcobinamide-phosphate guanylyltransferase [Tistlia sp.]
MPERLPRVTLVLGGARSGKSAHAEALVEGAAGACFYLATAEAGDAEMAERIAAHRARRGGRWRTLEEPLDLAGALTRGVPSEAGREPEPVGAILVDCLTLWLANLLGAGRDPAAETRRLLEALPGVAAPVVFVSNEVGLGIVPTSALGRRFRDEAGRLNQAVAAAADRVVFVAAGLPLVLKSTP